MTPPVTSGHSASEAARDELVKAASPEPEDAIYDDSLGEFLALDPLESAATPAKSGAPAYGAQTTTDASKDASKDAGKDKAAQPALAAAEAVAGDLPWERASSRIGSPMLRLHNGVRLTAGMHPTSQKSHQVLSIS